MGYTVFIQPFYVIHRDTLCKLIWNHLWQPSPVEYLSVTFWVAPFLIYDIWNDIWNSSRLFKCILLADDTNFFITTKYTLPIDIADVEELSNNELVNINECLMVNRFSLNVTKTKYMAFHPMQKRISSHIHAVKINSIQEKVYNFNFLWFVLNSNLKWDRLIKQERYSGIFNNLKRYIPIAHPGSCRSMINSLSAYTH